MTRMTRSAATLLTLCTAAVFSGPTLANDALVRTQPEVLARAEAEDRDGFGSAVTISGDTAAVSATGANGPTDGAGAVYLYQRHQGQWHEGPILRPENVGAQARLGSALALDRGWLAAGAPGVYSDLGAVYLYHNQEGTWEQQSRLTPAGSQDFVFFGTTLDMAGGALAVGAPGYDAEGKDSGLVMTYRLTDSGEWSEGEALSPDSPRPGERFGTSVALDGNRLIVGAAGAQGNEAAYLFDYRNGAWQQSARLSEDFGAQGAGYGAAVTLRGDTALVGARRAPGESGEPEGAVLAYKLANGTWTRQATLRGDSPARRDQFGAAVAFDGQTALIAAPRHDAQGDDAGSVFVFTREGSQWSLQGRLPRPDPQPYDNFGATLALDPAGAWVGTPTDVAPGSDGRGTGTVMHYQTPSN